MGKPQAVCQQRCSHRAAALCGVGCGGEGVGCSLDPLPLLLRDHHLHYIFVSWQLQLCDSPAISDPLDGNRGVRRDLL